MARGRQGGGDSVPHDADTALLIIDMISDFEFEDGARLLRGALPAARAIARLKKRARAANVPVIYVNDNFGQWRSDFRQLLQRCLNDGVAGEPVARLLAPDAEDYFVLKPANSGFFATPLEALLKLMGVKKLVLTGVAADHCILFTAADAYVRNYALIIPGDCVAAVNPQHTKISLPYFKRVMKADVRPAARVQFSAARARKQRS
jgi:nicotinamidase-related amidase